MVMGDLALETDVAVIGAGPGGYAAAFRAADLGLETVLIDTRERPGGVCSHVGCIPSKALLFVSSFLGQVERAAEWGVTLDSPGIDIEKLRGWKDGVVARLTGGLLQLAERRGVQLVQGRARFQDSRTLRIEGGEVSEVRFRHALVATGSSPVALPGIEIESPRLMHSSGALALADLPATMLVVGGGYIGLELGTVYASLGSRVSLVELTGGLLPGVDRDLVRPLARHLQGRFEAIHLNSRVLAMKETKKGIEVEWEGQSGKGQGCFERVLVAVGRRPNSADLGLETTAVQLDEEGFILTNQECRTEDERIFAVGDVAGQPMLAHKASREGKVAAEVMAGHPAAFDNRVVPAIVFTDPEIAWCGLSETEARGAGRKVQVGRFPWAASGRAATMGESQGLTKVVCQPETGEVLGVGMVGSHAGELIAEAVLAIEMGAEAEDLASTIHAHPTLSETLSEAAEVVLGRALHIFKGGSS